MQHESPLTHPAGPDCCPPREVGWVFHSVALWVANRNAARTGRRWRVRAARDGGWVTEPCS